MPYVHLFRQIGFTRPVGDSQVPTHELVPSWETNLGRSVKLYLLTSFLESAGAGWISAYFDYPTLPVTAL